MGMHFAWTALGLPAVLRHLRRGSSGQASGGEKKGADPGPELEEEAQQQQQQPSLGEEARARAEKDRWWCVRAYVVNCSARAGLTTDSMQRSERNR